MIQSNKFTSIFINKETKERVNELVKLYCQPNGINITNYYKGLTIEDFDKDDGEDDDNDSDFDYSLKMMLTTLDTKNIE